MFINNPSSPPIDLEICNALCGVQTSTLGHMQDYGFPRFLRSMNVSKTFAGTAVTVQIPHLDSTALHVAVDSIRPGDVLVLDQCGDNRSAFGGMVSFTAKTRGAVGALISGGINDVPELVETNLPIYFNYISARTTRILGVEGSINIPVSVGGTVINPGDLIYGDQDGVAVLPRDAALKVRDILKEKENREPDMKRRIQNGEALSELSGAWSKFKNNSAPETR